MRKIILFMLVPALLLVGHHALAFTADTTVNTSNPDPALVKTDTAFSSGTVLVTPVTTTATKIAVAPAAQNCTGCAWAGWLIIALILVVFFIAIFRSNMLRDAVTDPNAFLLAAKGTKYANVTDPNKIPRTFSLSRTQLGLWTVLIACSYVYIELCRGCCIQQMAIDQNLLLLMGISAATAAGGNVIDANNQSQAHHQDGPSDGFFSDILSDQNGISVHRFQHVAWTLVAMVIYICQINKVPCGSLPTLDSTLVLLTGISSVTYLGLKINENKPPQPPVVPPTPDPAPQPAPQPDGAPGVSQ
ncbi:hypothetical protein MUY27_11560 [Mucilaginibacter sp. RS28]|uniref:Uncharacterized protein n=1 Tax=Mucilaginibacter straminoryzae TaxID=2932774 RepID=A0A9X2B9C8_9SPHI|nr:hypothetical protein [Mucilaginibacter straminoryzae]MCJ8210346.1 hypothetical protein [Mucilaginibacter straminoryzae]